MIHCKLFLLLILFFSLFAHAGSDVGNGGVSLVCRDNQKIIKSAELLDTFEGKILRKRTYEQQLTFDEYLDRALVRLHHWPKFKEIYLKHLAKIKENVVLIPTGIVLARTDDVVINVNKPECQYEQLAIYTDVGEIYFSEEIFSRLNETDKAGIYVHEAVYAALRELYNPLIVREIELIGIPEQKLRILNQDSRRLTAQLLADLINYKDVDEVMHRSNRGEEKICGLNGTLEDRVKDCDEEVSPFKLVSRTGFGKESYWPIYQSPEGRLWSLALKSLNSERKTSYKTRHSLAEALKVCQSYPNEIANLQGIKWVGASRNDFDFLLGMNIYKTGILSVFPYWTSTPAGNHFYYVAKSNSNREDERYMTSTHSSSEVFTSYMMLCTGTLE